MPYARKVDSNHGEIIAALRKVGWTVVDTSRVGEGFPDAIAARRGRVEFVEIKRLKGKLTADQVQFHASMLRSGVTVKVLRDVQDAIRL